MSLPSSNKSFPDGFVWGAATAAYQIEGATHEGGRGESIWDRFCTVPGAVLNGDTGEVACDHYHRWRDDIAMMRELRLQGYRYSVAWPRIFPEGKGTLNTAGLDFYDRLTDGLLEAGITPYVTLYHWDLPQALQDAGGWANRDTASLFTHYAEAVAQRLGDRVRHWITHNEPAVAAFVGNLQGRHAPGIADMTTAYAVAHHLLLSHGMAVQALRTVAPGAQVGITLDMIPMHPAGDAADETAARLADGFQNRWFLDPVFKGRYPADILEAIGPHAPDVQPGDMETISVPVDFLGINYYRRWVLRYDPKSPPFYYREVHVAGAEYTEMDWEIYPDGLRECLERVHKEYNVPAVYVTENGASYPDVLSPDGTVSDTKRRDYLDSHFHAALDAMAAGVPLKGYFVWSLMDNFEWSLGYSRRFGIVYVDYPTERRIPKESALWYRDWINNGG